MDIKKVLDRLTELSEARNSIRVVATQLDPESWEFMATVGDNPDPIGSAIFVYDEDLLGWYSQATDVDYEYQRQGIGTALYDAAKRKLGTIVPSDDQTDDAIAFWKGKEMWEGQSLARPKMPGAGMTPGAPKDVAKKAKKLDLFKSLEEELTETEVFRRISQKFESFKQELDEYGGYSGTTGATAQPQTNGTTGATDDKQKAAELQQTQKTLQTLKPQLQKAGAQNIDVNRMTQALTQVDANPGQQVTGQTATVLNKLAPGVADALKNPQSAQMLKTAIEKGEQASQIQQAKQAQAQKKA